MTHVRTLAVLAAARRYLHAVDGRDKEIAKRLSELAAHGDSTQLPTSALK